MLVCRNSACCCRVHADDQYSGIFLTAEGIVRELSFSGNY